MPRKSDLNPRTFAPARLVWLLATVAALGFTARGFAYVKTFPLRLSVPVLTNGTVQLTFTAEAGVEYVVESLTNLQTWMPVATNNDPQIARVFDLGPASDSGVFRVMRKQLPVFSAALAAINGIDFNGWSIQTDSFDSSNPLYSVNGQYPRDIPSKQKDNGHIITNGGLTNSTGLGVQQIKGKTRTGPTGSVELGSIGSVGSKEWVEAGNVGIQLGYGLNDMNVIYPPATLPQSPNNWSSITTSGTVGGVAYNKILGNGDYYFSSATSFPAKMYVNGNARVWVSSIINLTGSDLIRIATNASLQLYMSGGSAKFGGNGVINSNQSASAFLYFGLPSNTNAIFTGYPALAGSIYAPGADVLLSSSSTNGEYVGTFVGKTISVNGNSSFHFDENLTWTGPKR